MLTEVLRKIIETPLETGGELASSPPVSSEVLSSSISVVLAMVQSRDLTLCARLLLTLIISIAKGGFAR